MQEGVRAESDIIGLEIFETIFHQTATGLLLEGADRTWAELHVFSNTFHENDRAICFSQMPGGESRGFAFHNNLFLNSRTADLVVEQGLKRVDFGAMLEYTPAPLDFNWTTRKALPETPPAESTEVSLFVSSAGQTEVSGLNFVSLDPGSPHEKRGTRLDPKKFGPQIGAPRGAAKGN
jgi:hypothetical protein